MQKIMKIVGLVVTFFLSAIVGYMLPIDFIDIQFREPAIVQHAKIEDPTTIVTPSQNIELNTDVVQQDSIATTNEDVPVEGTVDKVPKNIIAQVWTMKNSIYYQMVVTAEVESGDALECVLKTSESSDNHIAKGTFKDGKFLFTNIPPVDDGTYYVSVVNTTSQDKSGIVQTGFNKMAKWSKEEVTQYLNAMQTPKDFYLHFVDLKNLEIQCVAGEGVDAASLDKVTLERLRTDRTSFGWTLTVVETPQYDKFNRISKLTINISAN